MTIHDMVTNSHTVFIQKATELLGVSRSGYYRYVSHLDSNRKDAEIDDRIRKEMQAIAGEYTRYGYRRMTVEIENRGFHINHKKVLRLMHEEKLVCSRKGKVKPITTNSNHSYQTYPNLVKGLKMTHQDQVWASDITYVRLNSGFVYLAVIIDQYTKRCVGWELSRNVDTSLTLSALLMAIQSRKGKDLTGLIHHSDQGVQYASTQYVECLQEHGMSISMSAKGCPFENPYAESFIKTIKYEEVYLKEYEDFQDAYENIGQFIDDVYNTKRLHSSIGYKSPIEFEMEVSLNIIS